MPDGCLGRARMHQDDGIVASLTVGGVETGVCAKEDGAQFKCVMVKVP